MHQMNQAPPHNSDLMLRLRIESLYAEYAQTIDDLVRVPPDVPVARPETHRRAAERGDPDHRVKCRSAIAH